MAGFWQFQGIYNKLQNLTVADGWEYLGFLFDPLRRNIQDFIDRRFFRRRYNAEQVLATSTNLARSETNLDHLTAALLGLAYETAQPEHVNLWLKPDSPSNAQEQVLSGWVYFLSQES